MNQLPYVKINFANGAIGGSAAMDDGCTGLVCTAEAVTGGFQLGTNYLITALKQLKALGIDEESEGANANVYKCVKEFYDVAPLGSRLYLRGVSDASAMDDLVDSDPDSSPAWDLLRYAKGEIRILMVKVTDPDEYSATIANGLDGVVYDAIEAAQTLADDATEDLKAPLLVLLEGRHYTGNASALADLRSLASNRVAVVIGDTMASSTGAAVGLLAGRIAAIPVQRSIARVKDGPIASTKMYIKNQLAELGSPADIHDKGFICPRTFAGKGGYFWSDDTLATAASDDYCYIPLRRTADKAYRVAYAAMLQFVNDEIAVTAEGKIAPTVCKGIETALEGAVINNMTSQGNLGTDPDDPNDTGVVAYVSPDQNIVQTSHLDVQLRIRPYGYAKYIEVDLGFQTLNN